MYSQCVLTKVNGIEITFKNLFLTQLLFKLQGKILFLQFTFNRFQLTFINEVWKYIVLNKLLGNCTGSFRKMSACKSYYSSSKNSLGVNPVVLIKPGVFDSNKCMLKIFRNFIDCHINAVGTGLLEIFDDRCIVIRIGNRSISLWFDAGRSNLRCIINDSFYQKTGTCCACDTYNGNTE